MNEWMNEWEADFSHQIMLSPKKELKSIWSEWDVEDRVMLV